MADTDECDVLVVGLGPAGAAAATAAAKAGARVLAIERRQTPGGAANCPEFIPIPLGLNAHADHVVIQKIVGARNHLSDGTRADSLLPGCVVNRDAFDRALVDFSRAAGAKLLFDATLAGLDADHSQATLSRGGCVRTVQFRALVAADGHASTVARLLGLPVLQKMHTVRYRVSLHAPQDAVDVWISPRFPGGYGWLIPAGREAVIGTGIEEAVASEALEALHRQLAGAGLVAAMCLAGPQAPCRSRDSAISSPWATYCLRATREGWHTRLPGRASILPSFPARRLDVQPPNGQRAILAHCPLTKQRCAGSSATC